MCTLAGLALGACTPAPPPGPGPKVAAPVVSAAPAVTKPVACVIDGTVRDGEGKPVEDALLAAVAPYSAHESGLTRSAADGSFCFEGLPKGEYGLTITSPKVTSTYVDVLPAGGEKGGHALDVRLGGEGFVLRGAPSGEAATPGKRTVRISRMSNFLADTFVVESGEDGSFVVRLPPGTYRAAIETEDAIGFGEGIALERDLTVAIPMKPINARTKAPPAEVTAWLRSSAIALTTAEAGHGFADMEPLAKVVGGARVVALGEATHGTREFFQLKHRMLEYLVEKLGFRAFAIEATFAECLAIDEYVRTGKGFAEPLVGGMRFWTWDTEEVVALVEWIARYNRDPAHKEKVRFFGFDMQSPPGSVIAVADALRAIDRKLWDEVAGALEPLDDDWSSQRWAEASPDGRYAVPAAELAAAEAAAKKLTARFDEKRAADVKKLGAERWALARIHAHVIADFVEMVKTRGSDWSVRDRAMAANALRLSEMLGPTSKMVLWAHNGHVQKWGAGAQVAMGKVLSDALKAELAVFGFAFDRGSFQAFDIGPSGGGLADFKVGAAAPGTLDGVLAQAGLPLFAIDLRAATGAAAAWARKDTTARAVGSVYNESNPESFFDTAPPAEQYDALFFVRETTAAHPNPGVRKAKSKSRTGALGALANGGFEDDQQGQAPSSWYLQSTPRGVVYDAKVSASGAATGKVAVAITRSPTPLPIGAGTLTQAVDAAPFRGKRAHVTAQVKLTAKGIGDEAYLMAMSDGGKAGGPQVWRGAVAGKGWREVAVDVDVPADATTLALSIVVTGDANVAVDDVAVTAK